MDQTKLNEVLRLHALHLASDGVEGERANLTGADLRGAYLFGADLTDEHRT